MDFQMNDESGVLIEGFEREPMIKQPWHPPYYQRRCEAAGLTKAMDLLMWERHVFDAAQVSPQLLRIAQRAQSTATASGCGRCRAGACAASSTSSPKVYNSAWSRNWGFVPYSKEDLDAYALDLQLVYAQGLVHDRRGRWADRRAWRSPSPTSTRCSRRCADACSRSAGGTTSTKGRIIDRVRVGFLGVIPEYQHTGAGVALYLAQYRSGERTRQKGGEMGWILETNHSMNRAMEALGGRIVKRFRVYERVL